MLVLTQKKSFNKNVKVSKRALPPSLFLLLYSEHNGYRPLHFSAALLQLLRERARYGAM
jgi:hypothetical protein